MQWLRKLATIAGGEERAKDLLEAKGISLILKSISVNFRVRLLSTCRLSSGLKIFPKRPVNFPDTVRNQGSLVVE